MFSWCTETLFKTPYYTSKIWTSIFYSDNVSKNCCSKQCSPYILQLRNILQDPKLTNVCWTFSVHMCRKLPFLIKMMKIMPWSWSMILRSRLFTQAWLSQYLNTYVYILHVSGHDTPCWTCPTIWTSPLNYFLVIYLKRGVAWMKKSADADQEQVDQSRSIYFA